MNRPWKRQGTSLQRIIVDLPEQEGSGGEGTATLMIHFLCSGPSLMAKGRCKCVGQKGRANLPGSLGKGPLAKGADCFHDPRTLKGKVPLEKRRQQTG